MGLLSYECHADAGRFWETHPEVDAATREAIEELRTPRPFWVRAADKEAVARWEVCWRVAAAHALSVSFDDDDRELRIFVWKAARDLYASDLPTDDPPSP